jgi:peptidoglycan/xylan/chitin deacetylase (PgdA/CDA1 family)
MNHNDGRIPLLVTFDDGGKSAYRPTADLLEERGWIGHFFITTDFIGAPGFVNAAEIRELRRRGHVIGSHSCSHPPRMSACLPEQIHDEWQRSTTVLGEILGEPVTVASIPAGYYSQQVARAADDCGIQALFSSEPQRQSWKVGNCTVFGRYCAFDRTPPARVAAVVRGELSARLLEYAAWNAKKIVKKTSGGAWLKFRATVLGSGR